MTVSALIELPADVEKARPVLAAAISLFGPDATVALWTQAEVNETLAGALGTILGDLSGGRPIPVIDLLEPSEAQECDPRVSVRATGDPMADAEATVLMAAVALQDWGLGADESPTPAEQALADRDRLVQLRDQQAPTDPPVIAVVVQVQSTFGAAETICSALAADPRVRVEVVVVESEHELRDGTTADFVRSLGYEPRDAAWFEEQLADPTSPLAMVLFYDPWEEFRPAALGAVRIAQGGVRMAYVAYASNVVGGDRMEVLAYNQPVHRLAWRLFTRTETSRRLFAEHCDAGAGAVRVMGTPKLDRVAALDRVEPLVVPQDRAVVLWNPHFSFGPEGWSTFDRYLGPIVQYAQQNERLHLVVRPHFRLMRDLPLLGGSSAKALEFLLEAADRLPNVDLDTSPDYLPAFAAVDAMITDLSSLATEFCLTRKPWCFLVKEDGPSANEDSQYFYEGPVATSWDGVERFLDHVVEDLEAIRGRRDLGAESRELLLRRHFADEDGHAGERIAAHLVDELLAERSRPV